jgi:hypothetical protein
VPLPPELVPSDVHAKLQKRRKRERKKSPFPNPVKQNDFFLQVPSPCKSQVRTLTLTLTLTLTDKLQYYILSLSPIDFLPWPKLPLCSSSSPPSSLYPSPPPPGLAAPSTPSTPATPSSSPIPSPLFPLKPPNPLPTDPYPLASLPPSSLSIASSPPSTCLATHPILTVRSRATAPLLPSLPLFKIVRVISSPSLLVSSSVSVVGPSLQPPCTYSSLWGLTAMSSLAGPIMMMWKKRMSMMRFLARRKAATWLFPWQRQMWQLKTGIRKIRVGFMPMGDGGC